MTPRFRSKANPTLQDHLRDCYAALAAARSRFEQAADRDAIDAAIYDMAALERRIALLRRLLASGVSLS